MGRKFTLQLFLVFALGLSFLSSSLWGAEEKYKMFTGSKKGTYYSFGKSISGLYQNKILVESSPGSMENVLMLGMNFADFAICQLDVLTNARKNSKYQSLTQNVLLVCPLYREEIHILVNKSAGITGLSDLAGKKINLGTTASGSFYSAKRILDETGMDQSAMDFSYLNANMALQKLVQGQIDVMFYTAGRPVPLLKSMPAQKRTKIALLDLGKTKAEQIASKITFYYSTTIPAGTYTFQDGPVHTICTPCVLVARKAVPHKVTHQICSLIFENRSTLAQGHEKWSEVKEVRGKLMARLNVWPFHPGAQDYFLSPNNKGILKLMTGVPNGTYAVIGEDIKKMTSIQGQNIRIIPSKGSVHSLVAVSLNHAHLGLTQLDVLLFLSRSPYRRILRNIRTVLPLYQEEVHILVRRDSGIDSISDMKGKKINCGRPASGTFITAAFLFKLHGMQARYSIIRDYSPPKKAMENLLNGQIDAMFFIGGKPIGLLANMSKTQAAKVKLLPLDLKKLTKLSADQNKVRLKLPYRKVTIPAGTYPFLSEDIVTIATPCVLVCSANLPSGRVKILAKSILDSSGKMKHPKWKKINYQRTQKTFSSGEIFIPLHPGVEYLNPGRRKSGR